MLKIVFDADALIKLAHTGILTHLSERFLISHQVFTETVIEGKKRLYPDAFVIEELIAQQKVVVKTVSVKERKELGIGEMSSLVLLMKEKADLIVSDDRKFLAYLSSLEIAFVIPTEFIVGMAKSKRIKIRDGKEALIKIKPFVRVDYYISAMKALGGNI